MNSWGQNRIGDYVHLKWSNYLAYGLQKPIYDKDNNQQNIGLTQAQRALQTHRENLKKQIQESGGDKETIRSTLESQLNYFYNLKDDNYVQLGLDDNEAQEVAKKIQQVFEKVIKNNDKLGSAVVDYTDLSAYKSPIEDAALQSKINKYKDLNQKQTTYDALSRRIQDLIEYRKQIPVGQGKDIKKSITNLETKWKSIKNDIDKEDNEISGKHILTTGLGGKKGFIAKVNSVIKQAKVKNDKQLLGITGEYMAAIIPFVLNGRINKTVDDIVKEFTDDLDKHIVGEQRSYKVLDPKNFIGKATMAEFFDGTELTTSYTQDKVDIVLQYEQKNIPASVKNINMYADIHILQGTSILKYCQFNHEFTNHFLNLTSQHEDMTDASGTIATEIQEARNLMKITIGLKALSGGLLQSTSLANASNNVYTYGDKAELFIVNEHGGPTGGQFKVYFVEDIMKDIINNYQFIKIKDYDENPPVWTNKRIGDDDIKSYKSANIRIAKILQQLHQYQLEVSISKMALKG